MNGSTQSKFNLRLKLLSTLAAFSFYALACKAKHDEKEKAADTFSPVANAGAAEIQGLPSNPSKNQKLSVSVSGATLTTYQYALLSDSTLCDKVKWSEEIKTDVQIADDLGEDGTKTLCILAFSLENGQEKSTSFSYSWVKDSTPPLVKFLTEGDIGPSKQAGNTFTLDFEIFDALTQVNAAILSLSNGDKCLNLAQTEFNAPCPTYLNLTKSYDDHYRLELVDSAFGNGISYTASVQASDKSGNLKDDTAPFVFTWDASPPAPIATLSALANQQDVTLTWSPAADNARYLIVRRAFSPVSALAPAGDGQVIGYPLGNDNFIACSGAASTCVDSNLAPYTLYHYEVFSYDAAGNVSASGARAQVQTLSKPAFQGLTRVFLASPNRNLSAEWQSFSPSGVLPSTLTYGLFAADSSGDQNYATPVATAQNAEGASFVDGGTNENLYLSAKQWASDNEQDGNTRELRLSLAPGMHHKLAATGRFQGQDPLGQSFLSSVWAVAVDPFGNIVFGGAPGRINVICKEATQAYYCKNRSLEKIYTFAGTDGSDDGSDASLGSATSTGEPYGISFDAFGNMFIADSTNFRIRSYCYNPEAPGLCDGKKVGYAYHLAGTGSSVDGADDTVGKTSGIGKPFGISADLKGNIYVADNSYRKIRVICANASAAPCLGKVVGNIYSLVGTGVAGDASDNLPATAANLGNIGAVALDARGNVFFSDNTYFRIRALCLSTSGVGHFCSGKTVGNTYRVTGTGVTGDGVDNIAAAAAPIATVNGIALTATGNLFFTDSSVTGNRIRAVCFNTAADYYCNGRIAGNSYRISGTGASTDGATGTLGVAVSIGSPRGLALDTSNNLIFADPTNRRIRMHCANASAGSICNGKLPDYHYQVAGNGASSLGWNLNAFQTPIGLPQGLGEDPHGNLYFADATNFVARVICYDTNHNGFCLNKVQGHSYIIAGNGVTGNALDNVLAIANPIGTITGVEVDGDGNVLLADNTNRTVRLVCGVSLGLCAGKAVGNIYRLIGNTTAADTADNVVAVANALGQVAGIALDAQQNIWIADAQYFRVRLYCRNTTGACLGKTLGNIYRIIGTGVTGNAADAALGATGAVGTLTSIDVDAWNNIVLGDSSSFLVRVFCNNAAGGYCLSKSTPAGRIYRAMGTGITGDAISDVPGSSSAISAMNAVQADDRGNLYSAEVTNRRIRILCVDTSAGYCLGLTAGNSYRMIGSGLAGDSSSGATGSSSKIDTPSRDSLLFTASGKHLVYVSGGTPAGLGSIRVFVGY